ncbi:MAG: AAA family ATPase, partial [Clostridia bacterium]|nr:AAA family ATPase [Clostridia bacterium]
MRCGICLCGLNGCGKTTLAKALAETLGFKHLDIENYYFSTDDNSYSSPKTREEVETLLQNDIKENPCFVFSVVNPDISTEINNSYDVIIYLSAPTEVRMERLRTRSFEKFGNRILPGGDMYEKEMDFLNRAAVKDSAKTEAWIKE